MNNVNKFFKEFMENTKDICVARIGKVVKFYPETMSVDVIPMPSDENSVVINVPVVTLKSYDYIIYYPLRPNDIVLLLFLDNDSDSILLGQDEATTERKHDISDCACLGGLTLLNNSVDVEEKDSLVIKSKNAKVVIDESNIKIEANKVEINSSDINLNGFAKYKSREIATIGDSTSDGATIVGG